MLKTFKFNKLIRDQLYDRMINKGIAIKLKTLASKEELVDYFKEKILEEALEVHSSTTKSESIEELADVLEVIRGFAKVLDIDFQEIEAARQIKLKDKGGFNDHIVVDCVSIDEEHHFAKYYYANPDKYPEIKDELNKKICSA